MGFLPIVMLQSARNSNIDMDSKLISIVENKFRKTDLPEIAVGDTVIVDTIVRDGDRKRTQKFQGLVIAMKGSGAKETITVRKISNGIGVEKVLPLSSKNIGEIKVLKKGDVRRSKLYYLRQRQGKLALKVKLKNLVPVEAAPEEQAETAE